MNCIIPFIHNNNELKEACEKGLVGCVLKNTIPFNWNFGLYGACLGNNQILIDKMISLGANDFNWALRGISQNGSLEDIQKIEKLAQENENEISYDWHLTGACLGNNLSAIQYFLAKPIKDINSAMRISCECGHQEAYDMIKDQEGVDITISLAGAFYGFRQNRTGYPFQIIKELYTKFLLEDESKMKYIDCLVYEMSYAGMRKCLLQIMTRAEQLNLKVNKVHIIRGATLGCYKNIIDDYINDDTTFKIVCYYECAYRGDQELIEWFEDKYMDMDEDFYVMYDQDDGFKEWYDQEGKDMLLKMVYECGVIQSKRKITDFDKERMTKN